MRHRFRLALAAGAILAGVAASVLLFTNTGWAGSVPIRAADPNPSSTGDPTPNDPAPTPPDPAPTNGPAPTGAPPPPEEDLPCEGGAAFDSVHGSWRPWIGCDGWILVLDKRFDNKEEARAVANAEAYIQSKVRQGRVKDGPGCLPPLVLC
jgi:hypothetical protein